MSLFADAPDTLSAEEMEKLFVAGISYLGCKAFPAAYSCFDRLPAKDFRLLYNKALCCFMIGWHDECHRLLCDAERLMPTSNITDMQQLPEAFLRYWYDEEAPLYPMPQGTPVPLAYTQLLRLKAETAYKLHLYSEVKNISARLGGKYKHIEKLIDSKKQQQ
jgi:hypothetical protein